MKNANRTTIRTLPLPVATAALALLLTSNMVMADNSYSSKLLLTGGVSQVEGAAGGGLTPWAVIGGYGTGEEIGANLHFSHADAQDFALSTAGLTVGLYDRVELSLAEQRFNVSKLNSALGGLLGTSDIKQTIAGVKVRLVGEAVLDQDNWMPQISAGVQYKKTKKKNWLSFSAPKMTPALTITCPPPSYLSAKVYWLTARYA